MCFIRLNSLFLATWCESNGFELMTGFGVAIRDDAPIEKLTVFSLSLDLAADRSLIAFELFGSLGSCCKGEIGMV